MTLSSSVLCVLGSITISAGGNGTLSIAQSIKSLLAPIVKNQISANDNLASMKKIVGPTKNFRGYNEIIIGEPIDRNSSMSMRMYELYLTPEIFELMVLITKGYIYDENLTDKYSVRWQFAKLMQDYVFGVGSPKENYTLLRFLADALRTPLNSHPDKHYHNENTLLYNLPKIISAYDNSFKNERVYIRLYGYKKYGGSELAVFGSFKIGEESKTYFNPFLENLENDFNGDLRNFNDPKKSINLGILPNDDVDTVMDVLKYRYPKVNWDKIEVAKKEGYSHFSKGFLFRLRVKEDYSRVYARGEIQTDFWFNTKSNIQRINDIFENDENLKLWISSIKNWDNSIKKQIKDDLPNFTDSWKRTWRDNVAEQVKSFMRNWIIVQKLIDHDLKLEELNHSIDGIKKDLDAIREEIRWIHNAINAIKKGASLERKSLDYVGKIAGFIPIFDEIIQAIKTVSGNLIDVANKMNQ